MQKKGMLIAQVIVAGSAGTTAMTAFSYLLSEASDKNFKEPLLLAAMISRMMSPSNKHTAHKAGWLTHYAVGIFFALLYKYLLRKTQVSATGTNGAMIGAVTGLAAVAIWHSTFRLHPSPPHTHRRKFYTQLVVAHIIFGMVAVLLLGNKNKRSGVRTIAQAASKYLGG
ncbi:MAG: hypothetical protein ABIN67_19570 [Ferruginibacter sp.]